MSGEHVATPVPPAVEPPRRHDLDRSLVRALAWTGAVRWTVQAFTWITTIVVARLLSLDDYGIMTMASVYVNFVAMVSEFGIGTTIVTIRELTSRQVAQLNGFALGMGVVATLLSALLAWPLGLFYRSEALPPVIIAMGLTFLLAGVKAVPHALLQRALRFPRIAVIDGGSAVVQASVTLLLAWMGARYWSLVGGVLAGSLVTTALVLWSAPRTPVLRPRRAELASVLPFTRDTLLGRLTWYIYLDADFVVAGRRLGEVATGAYSFAWNLASAPLEKITTLAVQVTPAFFSEVQTDVAAMRRYFLGMTQAIALATFPLTIGLALTARDLTVALLGEKYLPMIAPLQVIAAYAGARAVLPFASQVLVALRDTRYAFHVTAVAAVVMPIGFIVGSRWGAVGIAATWIVLHPVVVIAPVMWRVSRRLQMGLGAYARALMPAMSGSVGMALAVVAAQRALEGSGPVLRLLLAVLAGMAGFGATLLLLHRREVRQLRGLLATMRNR